MTWFLDKREWTEVDQSVSIHSQLWSNIRICREVSCHHELTEHLQKLTNNIRKVFTGLVIESRALRSWDVCCFLSIVSKSLNFFNLQCHIFLDYKKNSKKSDDILDIMFRQKYEGTNITFKSIADLRRDFPSGEPLGVLHLIKSYVERTTRKDMVIYSFGVAPNILSQQVKYFK